MHFFCFLPNLILLNLVFVASEAFLPKLAFLSFALVSSVTILPTIRDFCSAVHLYPLPPSPPSVLLLSIPVPISLRPYQRIRLRSRMNAPTSSKSCAITSILVYSGTPILL